MSDMLQREAAKLNVRHIKMSSGVDIITTINLDTPDHYIIDSPYILIKVRDHDGSFYYNFEEYFPVNEGDHSVLYKSHIEAFCQVSETMKGNYLNAIVSQAEALINLMKIEYPSLTNETIH